jgi:pimeloyl-ACP methyl ester carboxylesterase
MKKAGTYLFVLFFGFILSGKSQEVKPMGLCLENYEYPYPVHFITLHIQNQSLKMAYMDVQAEHPNGHSIMLLHGKNFGGAYWKATIKALTENGYRVIVPDQIGFGKSAKPAMIQYSFQLLAQNTKAILDSLQINKLSVLGHSMGGMVGTRFVLMYPDMIEKFILEDPIGLEDWKLKVPYTSVDQQFKKEMGNTYASLKKYQLESYYHGEWKPEYDEWLNLTAGWLSSPEYNRVAMNAALTSDIIFTQPVCYEFDSVKVKTLLIIGELDHTAIGKDQVSEDVRKTLGNYPELGVATQKKIRDSRLYQLSGVGHIPHIEAFDRFMPLLLNFLKE